MPTEPYTAEDQVTSIIEHFRWTDAVKKSVTGMRGIQLWYYGYPAGEVCNGSLCPKEWTRMKNVHIASACSCTVKLRQVTRYVTRCSCTPTPTDMV
jgi:hypothetical protein